MTIAIAERRSGPGSAIPVGICRPPGGIGMPFSVAYCSASVDGHG